jgi:hypothetical protein
MTTRDLLPLALSVLVAGCGSVAVIEPSGGAGGGSPSGSGSGSGSGVGGELPGGSSSTGYPAPCSGPECTGVARLSTGVVRCAVRKNGDAACWGGKFPGNYDSAGDADPYAIPALHDAVAAAVGQSQMCFLRASGRVACLGFNSIGEVGSAPLGQTTTTPLDVPGVEDAVEIAAGTSFTCARLASGKVLCWGDAKLLGANLDETFSAPIAVVGLDDALSLSASADHGSVGEARTAAITGRAVGGPNAFPKASGLLPRCAS